MVLRQTQSPVALQLLIHTRARALGPGLVDTLALLVRRSLFSTCALAEQMHINQTAILAPALPVLSLSTSRAARTEPLFSPAAPAASEPPRPRAVKRAGARWRAGTRSTFARNPAMRVRAFHARRSRRSNATAVGSPKLGPAGKGWMTLLVAITGRTKSGLDGGHVR